MRIHGYDILRLLRRHFWLRTDGGIAPTFAIALVPLIGAVGAAVDYSRASAVKAALQSALDAAVLAAAADRSSSWAQRAKETFLADFAAKPRAAGVPTPSFTLQQNASDNYSGAAATTVSTTFLSIFGAQSIEVSAKSMAAVTEADNSCILTLDKNQPLSNVSLSLNGAPIVNLSGCSIRSNTSLDCNGHDGDVTKAIAAGTAEGCQRWRANASIVPDIYAPLAANIAPQCGSARPGVTWEPGVAPSGPGVIKLIRANYTEYHICGTLTLRGSGHLTGIAPSSDTVIVIENGGIEVANHAAISTKRTALVMTGDNAYGAEIVFPNGNGHSASLTLSPPTDPLNPWHAVALYQDPKLTRNVDARWGPGAAFNADGLVYLGNSNLVTDGDTASSNSRCTKFVLNRFTTNGKVALNFAQTDCASLGLKQWGGRPVRLVQ